MEEPGIWVQLARLDKCCTVRLRSFHAPGPAPAIRWQLTIRPRERSAGRPIVIEADTSLEAIIQGLAAAKAASWESAKDTAKSSGS